MRQATDQEDCGATRADLRRRRITDAARRLFVLHGFHATGMAQLAKESGVAIGQIYRDFQSKEEIVAALVESDCVRMMMYEQLESAVNASDSQAILAWLSEFLAPDDGPGGTRLLAEIVAESGRNPRIAAIFQSVNNQLRAHLHAALKVLAPGPSAVARREALAEALMTISVGLLLYRVVAPGRDVTPVLQVLKAMIMQELAL